MLSEDITPLLGRYQWGDPLQKESTLMTDLENRVAILEQELDVLKHQIQATLLEIQEQLLTNTYPALRSNGTHPETPSHNPPAPPVQSVKMNAASEPEASAKSSIIRMVNINEPARQQPTKSSTRNEVSSVAAESGPSFAEFEKYETWLSGKVEQLGVARARKLIKVYAKQGHLTTAVAKHLLGFLALYTDEEPEAEEQPVHRDDRSLILRLITGLSSGGERKHG